MKDILEYLSFQRKNIYLKKILKEESCSGKITKQILTKSSFKGVLPRIRRRYSY